MITSDDAQNAILSRLSAASIEYTDNAGTTQAFVVDLAQQPYPMGTRALFLSDEEVVDPPLPLWGAFSVVHTEREPTSLGRRRFHVQGSAYCILYVPLGTGGFVLNTVGRKIAELFDPDPRKPLRTEKGGTIYFRGSSVREVAPQPEQKWQASQVEAPLRVLRHRSMRWRKSTRIASA